MDSRVKRKLDINSFNPCAAINYLLNHADGKLSRDSIEEGMQAPKEGGQGALC